MIDIHTHILPDVDDGSSDIQESIKMARIAVADGITHLFATPHHRDYTRLSRYDVARRVADLQTRLDAENIPLKLIAGYEVRLYDDMFDDWDSDHAGSLGNSRYVLAEPLFYRYDNHTDEMLFELFDRGYIPIMAHPERIRPIQNDLSLIEPFLERGGLTQLTSRSLVSDQDWRAYDTAREMLRNGMAHIISSDAHKPYRRKPELSTAREITAEIVGQAQATAMVTTYPMAIINDEPMPIVSYQ